MKSKPSLHQLNKIKDAYISRTDEIDMFRQQVISFFQTSKQFKSSPLPLIHSIKSRLKDPDHLIDKVKRKWSQKKIDSTNLFNSINDLGGVRVLHLYTEQAHAIHNAIKSNVKNGNWIFNEDPIAYSWDPETTEYFKKIGLRAETRESYYSSIHYVVKPHTNSDITCEIQVRTLFEEIWGEIDHAINYPDSTSNIACKEQLKVLAKLASTGTRLADSIFKIARLG